MITDQVKMASSEAISFFGVKVQRLKAIEEMSELCIELARSESLDRRASSLKTAEEIADVIIVLAGLYEVYNADGWVDDFLSKKSSNLQKRIKFLKSSK